MKVLRQCVNRLLRVLAFGESFTLDLALLAPKKVVAFVETLWERARKPTLGSKEVLRNVATLSDILEAFVECFRSPEKGKKIYLPEDDATLKADLLQALEEVGGPDQVSAGGHPAIVASVLARLEYEVDLFVPFPERRLGLENVHFILPDGRLAEPSPPDQVRQSILIRITPEVKVHLDQPREAKGATRLIIVDPSYRPVREEVYAA